MCIFFHSDYFRRSGDMYCKGYKYKPFAPANCILIRRIVAEHVCEVLFGPMYYGGGGPSYGGNC